MTSKIEGKEESILNGKIKKAAYTVAGTFCALAAMPAVAFAEEEGGISAILPKMDEFIPMLIAFVILWAILAKFGWPIFEGMLAKRENTIREGLEAAERNRVESERTLAEYQKQLASARDEATAIIAEAKQLAEANRAATTAKAQAEADEIIAKARKAIESEKKAAIAELQSSVADLTVATMAKVIGEDFTDADHRKLIEASVAKAGNLDA